MAKTYTQRLDVNDDEAVDEFNDRLAEFTKKFGYDLMRPPEFVPGDQAAEFLGCSMQDIRAMVYRGVVSKGPRRGTVSLDDVISKRVIRPFTNRA